MVSYTFGLFIYNPTTAPRLPTTILSYNVFLIICSRYLLLLYGNTIKYYILVLYPITFLHPIFIFFSIFFSFLHEHFYQHIVIVYFLFSPFLFSSFDYHFLLCWLGFPVKSWIQLKKKKGWIKVYWVSHL